MSKLTDVRKQLVADRAQGVREALTAAGYKYHHSASRSGYVSRTPEGVMINRYKGKYGEGYTLDIPRFDKAGVFYREYYIKERHYE